MIPAIDGYRYPDRRKSSLNGHHTTLIDEEVYFYILVDALSLSSSDLSWSLEHRAASRPKAHLGCYELA